MKTETRTKTRSAFFLISLVAVLLALRPGPLDVLDAMFLFLDVLVLSPAHYLLEQIQSHVVQLTPFDDTVLT